MNSKNQNFKTPEKNSETNKTQVKNKSTNKNTSTIKLFTETIKNLFKYKKRRIRVTNRFMGYKNRKK